MKDKSMTATEALRGREEWINDKDQLAAMLDATDRLGFEMALRIYGVAVKLVERA